jgi:hypothetical protein
MKKIVVFFAAGLLLAAVPLLAQQGDPGQDKALLELVRMGFRPQFASTPEKPVIELRVDPASASTVGDAAMAQVAWMIKLQRLDLRGAGITDEGVKKIGGLADLRDVDLRGTRVTDAGVKYLKEKLPKLSVRTGQDMTSDTVAQAGKTPKAFFSVLEPGLKSVAPFVDETTISVVAFQNENANQLDQVVKWFRELSDAEQTNTAEGRAWKDGQQRLEELGTEMRQVVQTGGGKGPAAHLIFSFSDFPRQPPFLVFPLKPGATPDRLVAILNGRSSNPSQPGGRNTPVVSESMMTAAKIGDAVVWGTPATLVRAQRVYERNQKRPEVVAAINAAGTRYLSQSHMHELLAAAAVYAREHNGLWPTDLTALREWMLKMQDPQLVNTLLTDPSQPNRPVGYIYLPPPPTFKKVEDAQMAMVMYEYFDTWPGGVNIGLADGRVVFLDNHAKFRELLGTAQARIPGQTSAGQ